MGFFVNILLAWNVWDYSDQAIHLFGQICPLYSALWFLLCIPCLYLCRAIRRLAEQIEQHRMLIARIPLGRRG